MSGHSVYRTILVILLTVGLRGLPFLAGIALLPIQLALLEWFRKSELSCDRTGLLASQDPEASMRMLMKMAGGGKPEEMDLNARENPRWKALAESLIGELASCQAPEWFNKPPGTEHPTPPHQDNYYFNLAPPNVLTIWLALEDVDEENGCLRYVAGSHRRGFRPHSRSKVLGFSQGISDYSPQDRAQEVAIRLKAGDAVVHHGMTIHRADANHSTTRSRRALAMVFRGVSCRRDEAAYRRYESALQSQHQELGCLYLIKHKRKIYIYRYMV